MKILVTVEIDDYLFDPEDHEEREWFEKDVMRECFLHSNEVGDTIGEVVDWKYLEEVHRRNEVTA